MSATSGVMLNNRRMGFPRMRQCVKWQPQRKHVAVQGTWKGEQLALRMAVTASRAANPTSSSLPLLLPVTIATLMGKASGPSLCTFCLQCSHARGL